MCEKSGCESLGRAAKPGEKPCMGGGGVFCNLSALCSCCNVEHGLRRSASLRNGCEGRGGIKGRQVAHGK